MARSRRAKPQDIHDIAVAMPGAQTYDAPLGNVVYQVRKKSFVYLRNPRPDALDPATGKRLEDVVVLWVESEAEKQALVEDPTTPFFTTSHFNGYAAVLVQTSRIGELTRDELAEAIADSWLSRAPKRMAAAWLAEHPPTAPPHRGWVSNGPPATRNNPTTGDGKPK